MFKSGSFRVFPELPVSAWNDRLNKHTNIGPQDEKESENPKVGAKLQIHVINLCYLQKDTRLIVKQPTKLVLWHMLQHFNLEIVSINLHFSFWNWSSQKGTLISLVRCCVLLSIVYNERHYVTVYFFLYCKWFLSGILKNAKPTLFMVFVFNIRKSVLYVIILLLCHLLSYCHKFCLFYINFWYFKLGYVSFNNPRTCGRTIILYWTCMPWWNKDVIINMYAFLYKFCISLFHPLSWQNSYSLDQETATYPSCSGLCTN